MSCYQQRAPLWSLELCALGCAYVGVHPCAVTLVCAAGQGWPLALLAAVPCFVLWLQVHWRREQASCTTTQWHVAAAGPRVHRAGSHVLSCTALQTPVLWPVGSQGQIPTWLATWSACPQLLQAHSLGSPNWDSRLPLPGEDLCGCDIPPVCKSPAPECGS